jgi:hypothetical protein
MWELNIINYDPDHIHSWADYTLVDSDPTGNNYTAWTEFAAPVWSPSTSSPTQGVITIDFRIDKGKSWVLRSWANAGNDPDTILIHERGHYLIALLLVRDLVTLAPSKSIADGYALMNALDHNWAALDSGASGCYETSTDLSRNKINQDKWNQLLAALLLFKAPPAIPSLVSNAVMLFGCGNN